MPTITGNNALEWKMREMAKRAGKKFETDEPINPYENMSKNDLLAQKALIDAALEEEDKEE